VFLVKVNKYLGVRVGRELMTLFSESISECFIVIDLAVEDDCDGIVFVENRLSAGIEADNAEASMSEPHGTIDVDSRFIRASMEETIVDFPERRLAGGARRTVQTRYTTHERTI